MAKNMQPVAKRCRALGISPASMGYYKKNTEMRKPGGQMRKKKSEYATQLQEKQKVKFVYGIMEKQFHSYYEKASRMPGKTGDNLLVLIERRLDNVVFRLGFAATPPRGPPAGQSRPLHRQRPPREHPQLPGEAGHGHRPQGVQPQPGEDQGQCGGQRLPPAPRWLEYDAANMIAKVIAVPTREDIDMPIEEHLIVELYSK